MLALLFGVKFQRVACAGAGGIASGRGALQLKQRHRGKAALQDGGTPRPAKGVPPLNFQTLFLQ
jgi:hypothetical protein